MGRAMLIICSAVLISMGYIGIGSSNQGKMLNEKVVDYADFTIAKNAAHTAIQIAMQKTNADDNWPNDHDTPDNSWITTIQGVEVALYTDYKQDPDYWEPDSLRLYSNAEHEGNVVQVTSFYQKAPFSTLVPDFAGALQLPTDVGNFTVDGAAHEINGISSDPACTESKPPIAVSSEETKQKLDSEDLKKNGGSFEDGDILVDPSLNYEPTDELIARLLNSGNAETIYGDKSVYGTASNPGVFVVDGAVKLKGNTDGYGILIIRGNGSMEMESDPELSVAGSFNFNGLVIFENAYNFDGHGTPTINGSVLIGETSDYTGAPIDINIGGNIEINYECSGENYARMAAASAVAQNKYSRIVTRENVQYVTNSTEGQSLIDKIKSLL